MRASRSKFNLARCEEDRGKLATAWALYKTVVEQLPAGDERIATAKEKVAALDKRAPRIVITLADGAPKDTKVKVGDMELAAASFGSKLPVDPGEQKLVVTAPGHGARKLTVNVEEGRTEEIEVGPGAPGAPDAASAEGGGGAHAGGSRTFGFVLGGIGVASLAVGAITGMMALGKKSTGDEHCSDQLELCDQQGIDANDSAKSLATVSTVGWVVGALGVGAGAYFILTSDSSKGETALRTTIGPRGVEAAVVRRW